MKRSSSKQVVTKHTVELSMKEMILAILIAQKNGFSNEEIIPINAKDTRVTISVPGANYDEDVELDDDSTIFIEYTTEESHQP